MAAVERVPTQRESAVLLITEMTRQDSVGGLRASSVPGLPGTRTERARVFAALLQGLKATAGAPARLASRQAATGGLVTPMNTSFPIRGYATNGNYSWYFPMELRGEYCDAFGCTITDDVRQKWTIDPGRSGDRLSFTSVYSPNGGHFSNVYVDVFSYINGSYGNGYQYPPSGPRNGQGSGVFSIAHASSPGARIYDEVELFGTFSPTANTYIDSARTGTATCRTGTDTRCQY